MPTPLVVSPSYPVHDRVVTWPVPPLVALIPTYAVPAPCAQHTDTNPAWRDETRRSYLSYGSSVAGGGSYRITFTLQPPIGRLVAQVENNAAGARSYAFEGLAVGVIQDAGALAPGVSLPSIDRVYRLRVFLQSRPGFSLEPRHRVLLAPFNQNIAGVQTPSNLVGPNNAGGFGVAGDGAGQWQYVSYNRLGVNLLFEAVPLPAHDIEAVNCFEWVRVNGRAGFETEWVFRWNGEDVISRNYASGLLTALDITNSEWAYCPIVEASGAVAGNWYFNLECAWGRFLPNGVEIQG